MSDKPTTITWSQTPHSDAVFVVIQHPDGTIERHRATKGTGNTYTYTLSEPMRITPGDRIGGFVWGASTVDADDTDR